MRSLTARVVALAVLVALATAVVLTVAFARATGAQNLEQASATAATDAQAIAAVFEARAAGESLDSPGAAVLQVRFRKATGLITAVGRPATGYAVPPPFSGTDVQDVLAGREPTTERGSGGVTYAVAGVSAGRVVVLTAQPVTGAARLTTLQWRRLILTGIGGVLLGALAGLLLARGVTRPLARVAESARRMVAGERDLRVPENLSTRGPAEVADVAVALDDLADALARSEQRQRQFLLAVSHELRTPLTAVSGYAEVLADGTLATPREIQDAGAVVRDEAQRLQRRVEDLLALARLEADDFRLELGPVDVAAVLNAAAAAFTPRAIAAEVDLRVEAPASGPVVTTDGERLRQIVDALADNALRVIPPGAPLVLGCRGETPGWLRVEVRDGGPGLAPADLAVAFDRGVLTERYRGTRSVGSGLGLALVGELARRLGGRPVAEPSPEGGVTFAVILPTAR